MLSFWIFTVVVFSSQIDVITAMSKSLSSKTQMRNIDQKNNQIKSGHLSASALQSQSFSACQNNGNGQYNYCDAGFECDTIDNLCIGLDWKSKVIAWGNQGICDFYTGYDDIKNCGSNGYLLGYGYKYCNRFYETAPLFTAAGQDWINCVRKNLTSFLTPKFSDYWGTCDQIKSVAFNSHPQAYIDCGFCTICKDNKKALLETFDLKDFFSVDAVKQLVEVALHGCSISCFLSLKEMLDEIISQKSNQILQVNP